MTNKYPSLWPRLALLLALLLPGTYRALAQQNVGIGTTAPTQTLDVNGNVRVRGLNGTGNRLPMILPDGTLGVNAPVYGTTAPSGTFPTAATGSVGTNGFPNSIAVSGTTAYVVNGGSNLLQVFSVTNPASPVLLGSVATDEDPYSVAVSGTTVYVVNIIGNTLQVFSVANPASPALLGSVATDSYPASVAVSGTTAYVVNNDSNTLQLFNVANPASPVLLGSVATGIAPNSVAVSGTTAYVVNGSSNTLQLFNVANPASPVLLGSTSTGSGPRSVAVSGTTAYVVNQNSSTLQAFNVANPASLVLLGGAVTDSTPISVAVSGTTAYVANNDSNTLQAFNMASPASPVLLGSVTTGSGPRSVAVNGLMAYVVNETGHTLQVFTLPSTPRTVAVNPDGSFASVPMPSAPTLSVSGQSLSITGGNTVTLPSGADNLGNHTATQALNLQGQALTGTGSSISGVGVGIRADGGLNLGQNTTGNSIYLGARAGGSATSGSGRNLFLGFEAGNFAGSASNNNLFLGYRAGYGGSGGSNNMFLGNFSGYNNNAGTSNTFVGYNGGINNSSGSNNVGLGVNAGPTTGALTNTVAIGTNASVSQSNSLALGGTGTDALSVGIGTTAPGAKLDVTGGSIKISTAGQGLIFPDGSTQTTANRALSISGQSLTLGGAGGNTITLPTNTGAAGPAGPQGPAGSAGDTGPAGTNGTNGSNATAAAGPGLSSSVASGVTTVKLGGSALTAATDVPLAGNNLSFSGTGNVGIGTTAPAQTLDVAGTTRTTNAIVTTALTGTGANIGTTVGVGVRADGGLNLGQNTGGNNTNNSIYLGYQAGRINTGSYNLFTGVSSGTNNTSGGLNVFSGFQSGLSNTSGSQNVFTGVNSGLSNSQGHDNVFTGTSSGINNGMGNYNLFSGTSSGSANTSGSNNVFIGHTSGQYNSTGSNNTALGYGSGPASGSGALTNATALGANVSLTTSNTVVLGSGASVGIGTAAPAQKLDVTGGSIQISTAGQGLIFPDGSTETTANRALSISGQSLTLGGAGGNTITLPTNTGPAGPQGPAGAAGTAGTNGTNASVTANNGLTYASGNVKLGGTALSAATDVPLNSQNLTFSGTGKVGIGTSAPTSLLDLGATAGTSATDATTKKLAMYNTAAGDDFYGLGVSAGYLHLFANASSTGAPKMSIGSTGNVGIGTSAPLTTLDVRTADASAAITVGKTDNTAGALYLGNASHGLKRNYSSANDVGLYTTGANLYLSGNGTSTSQFVLTTGGGVGIGTGTPGATLQVERGTAAEGTARFSGTARNSHFNFSTAEDTYIRGGKATSNVYINDNGGNVGIGTSSPYSRLSFGGVVYANAPAGRLAIFEAGNQEFYGLGLVQNPSSTFGLGLWGGSGGGAPYNGSTGVLPHLYVGNTSNVGIGTITPAQRLDVTGGSIKISTTGQGLIFPDGTTQTTAATTATGAGFIQNTSTQQASSNFSISGNGAAGGTLSAAGNVASTGGVLQGGGVVSNRVGALSSFTAADAGMYFKAGGVLQLVSAGADRVTVDAGGNVGIGNTTPSSTLSVSGSVSTAFVSPMANLTLTAAHYTVRRLGGCNIITLPNPNTCAGRLYVLINSNGATTPVGLSTTSGLGIYDDVAGGYLTALPINTRYTIQSNGTDWIVVGR